jgi:hypothetical protein
MFAFVRYFITGTFFMHVHYHQKCMHMAEDMNKKRAEEGNLKKPVGRSGRRSGQAPQTTETGAQNNGGQTERVNDNKGKAKRGSSRS